MDKYKEKSGEEQTNGEIPPHVDLRKPLVIRFTLHELRKHADRNEKIVCQRGVYRWVSEGDPSLSVVGNTVISAKKDEKRHQVGLRAEAVTLNLRGGRRIHGNTMLQVTVSFLDSGTVWKLSIATSQQ